MVTPIYAGILGLFLVILGARAILLNPGGDTSEEKRVRFDKGMQAFSNFTEYTPLALLLIWFLEQQSGGGVLIHVLCLMFITGRLIHAFGVSQVNEILAFRVAGMALSFITIAMISVRLLISFGGK